MVGTDPPTEEEAAANYFRRHVLWFEAQNKSHPCVRAFPSSQPNMQISCACANLCQISPNYMCAWMFGTFRRPRICKYSTRWLANLILVSVLKIFADADFVLYFWDFNNVEWRDQGNVQFMSDRFYSSTSKGFTGYIGSGLAHGLQR